MGGNESKNGNVMFELESFYNACNLIVKEKTKKILIN